MNDKTWISFLNEIFPEKAQLDLFKQLLRMTFWRADEHTASNEPCENA